jgi:hypothetical protein
MTNIILLLTLSITVMDIDTTDVNLDDGELLED